MKFEIAINRVSMMIVERKKKLAKHHAKRLLKYYDEMTDIEKEVFDEIRIKLFV